MVKLRRIRCRRCGRYTEVNPGRNRSRPKYCGSCGAVILAARENP